MNEDTWLEEAYEDRYPLDSDFSVDDYRGDEWQYFPEALDANGEPIWWVKDSSDHWVAEDAVIRNQEGVYYHLRGVAQAPTDNDLGLIWCFRFHPEDGEQDDFKCPPNVFGLRIVKE